MPSPAEESPKNSPKVNIVAKPIQEETTEVDGEMTTKKAFGFEMKAKSAVVCVFITFQPWVSINIKLHNKLRFQIEISTTHNIRVSFLFTV